MSVAYYAFAMVDLKDDTVFEEWLASEGLTIPVYPEEAHFPSYTEVLALVTGIDGYTVPDAPETEATEANDNYSFAVLNKASNTEISLEVRGSIIEENSAERSHQDRQPGGPREFYFGKSGYDVTILIARRLAEVCGPLLLCNDFGTCAVVEAGQSGEECKFIGRSGQKQATAD